MQWLRCWWAPLLAIAIALFGCVVAAIFWELLSAKEESPSAILRNLGLVIAAPIVIILAIWRSSVAQEQTNISRQQADLSWMIFREERDRSQRLLREEQYRNAINSLGSDMIFSRLGSIDTLMLLAREYPVEFHLRVSRILSSFVRHPPEDDSARLKDIPPTDYIMPREDVQTIVKFFGSRTEEQLKIDVESNTTIDLHGADLSGTWLSPGSYLFGVNLSGANLSDVHFFGVRGIKQIEIDFAIANPGHPPNLNHSNDYETGKPLAWRQR